MRALVLMAVGATLVFACDGGLGASPTPHLSPILTPRPPDQSPETPLPVSNVPQSILDRILSDAADRTSVPRDELQIERAQAVTWSDGSLGCPEPDKFYIQVLVDGYWVEVRAGDEVLDYRGSGRDFRLCPPGMGNPPQ